MDQAGHVNGPTAAARPAWTEMIDLASARLGGRAVACSDDFFAGMENLVRPEPAVFIPGKYTPRGKWMDGWESRRKRVPGSDWCIVELGRPGSVRGVVIDTAHFNGNQPEFCTVGGAEVKTNRGAGRAKGAGEGALRAAEWVEIVPRTATGPSREHFVEALPEVAGRRFTHVRLTMTPDGGVARLRVHGEVMAEGGSLAKSKPAVDLASAVNGGLVIDANNMHFGSRHNMIMPGRAKNMGDGWETRRKRGLTWVDGRPAEFDWAIVKLGHPGTISRIDVDTNHFKGNFPESCRIEVCSAGPGTFDPKLVQWHEVLGRTKLRASAVHSFSKDLVRAAAHQPSTHVRISIYPDGGISRLRVWGRPAK